MIFKISITDTPLTEEEAAIVKENPDAFKINADVDVEGNLGELAAAVAGLMEHENGVAQVLISAVTDFQEKYPNYPEKS